jgi:hypothetical protein
MRALIATLPVEHSLTAAFNRITAAFLNAQKQFLHGLDLLDHLFQFLQLLSRQLSPSLRDGCFLAKSKEEFADFVEREPSLLSALNDRQPIQHGVVVPPLTAGALRRLEHSDLLVITNGRGTKTRLSRHFGDRHV